MPKPADYVLRAKAKLGDRHMSDRAFGERLGFASSTISNARYGVMSDAVAMKVAEVLGYDAGEVIMIARVERERDPIVQRALSSFTRRALATAEDGWRKRSLSIRGRGRALTA